MHAPSLRSLAAALICCLSQPVAAQYRLPMTAAEAANRIDSTVLTAMDTAAALDVIILGRTQLLAPVGGLEAFAAKNAKADRRALRRTVIAELKRIAAREQPAILRAIADRDPVTLWILNAVAARVSPAELRRLATMNEVRFIYPSFPLSPRADTGKVRAVLHPTKRPPFDPAGKQIAWYLEKLNVPQAWKEGKATGQGIVVASLDVGINYLHPDLTSNVWINEREIPENGRDDDGNGYIDDVYGFDFTTMSAEVGAFLPGGPQQHGSVTSAIMVGDGTEGILTGVAPRARIMALKGGAHPIGGPLAYQYALENGADVLNMSFSLAGLGNNRGLWRLISDHAVAAGLVLSGGSGNFRQTAAIPVQQQTPKDVPSVISVGGVDSTLQAAPFSSMGPAEWGSVVLYGDYPMPKGLLKPDVVGFPGPGYPVVTYPNGYLDPSKSPRGNSLSGPQASGIAALMLSAAPKLPAWRVLSILRATAHDLGPAGADNEFGAGLMDAAAAVRMAIKEAGKR